MKNLKQTIFALFIGLCVTSAQAQKSKEVKKSLFTEFPGSIEISKNTLKNTLVSKPGQLVSIPFNEKFIFTGKVVSNEMKYADLQTMIVKSEQYPNTLFQLSRIINKDNTISYVGRIMNNEALEVYEIKSYLADNYSLQKIDLDKILQDCSY
jgi:hypothetical protein